MDSPTAVWKYWFQVGWNEKWVCSGTFFYFVWTYLLSVRKTGSQMLGMKCHSPTNTPRCTAQTRLCAQGHIAFTLQPKTTLWSSGCEVTMSKNRRLGTLKRGRDMILFDNPDFCWWEKGERCPGFPCTHWSQSTPFTVQFASTLLLKHVENLS